MQDWWQQVALTAYKEFSDIPDPAQATRIVMRLTLAALLGGLLGWEREATGKEAGVRTHMLVCMGSAMFVMVAVQTGALANETSRVMQGVIAGIGFLGAGTILKEHTNGSQPPQVHGLTTAAGIWLTAAIGIAAGLGEEATALLSAVLAFGILRLVPFLLGRDTNEEAPPAPAPAADNEKSTGHKSR
ncbi:MgtC/SapB family protein [Comamonas sp.]